MRIFLDTNVLLDVYLKRAGEPASARVIAACGQPWNQGFVAVHTLSNAFYLIERQRTREEAWEFIHDVLAWAAVAAVVGAGPLLAPPQAAAMRIETASPTMVLMGSLLSVPSEHRDDDALGEWYVQRVREDVDAR